MYNQIMPFNNDVFERKIINDSLIMTNSSSDELSYEEWMKYEAYYNRTPITFYNEVKDIIGDSFSKDDYSKYFSDDCVYEFHDILSTRRTKAFDINEYGVCYDCGRGILTKDAIVQLIGLLTEQYNNYDIYHKRFLDHCRESDIERAYAIKKEKEEENIKNERSKQGYIYVMYHQGYYKIGKTKDCKRLGEYTRLAEEPEYVIVEYVDDMDTIEKEIHSQHEEERNRDGSCEWFKLTESDIDDIRKFLKRHSVKNHKHSKYYKRYVLKEI